MKYPILPDGKELKPSRELVIQSGYDHYWSFHKNPDDWAKFGCPICKEHVVYNNKLKEIGGE